MHPLAIATTAIFILLSPFFDSHLFAAEVVRQITVTTASRTEEPVAESTASLEVLTQAEIAVQNPVIASEVLRDLSGVKLLETGTVGSGSALMLRGAAQEQTLILLDGIRLNDPFRGGFDFGSFTLDGIAQIEVVRGGKSALYGADAIGGVVHLKTAEGRGPLKISYTQEAGSEWTFIERLAVSGGKPRQNINLSLSRIDSDGQFSRDRFAATNFTGRLVLPIRSSGRLDLITRFQNDNKDLPIDIIPTSLTAVKAILDTNRTIENRFRFYSVQYTEQVSPLIRLVWKTALIDTELDLNNPRETPASRDNLEQTTTRIIIVDLQQDLQITPANTFSFGLEQEWDEVDSLLEITGIPIIPINQSRRNTGYYLQNLFKWEQRFVFQAGLRLDDNSTYETVTTPKLSTVYHFEASETQIRGSWGKGFRAPAIQELFFPVFGDPNLKPEKSEDWEIGIRQKLGATLDLDIAFFRIDYADLIQKTPTGILNVNRARTEGIELALKAHPLKYLIIKSNFSLLKARNTTTGALLSFRPKRQANINLLFMPTVTTSINIDLNYVSSQPLENEFTLLDGTVLRGSNPGYTRVDLSSSYTLFGGFLDLRDARFYFKVRNIFDTDYQDTPGFPAPGSGFFGGMTASY